LNVSEKDMDKGSFDTKNNKRQKILLQLAVKAGARSEAEYKQVERKIGK